MIPGQRTKILNAVQHSRKKQKMSIVMFNVVPQNQKEEGDYKCTWKLRDSISKERTRNLSF